MPFSRRHFVGLAGLGGAAALVGGRRAETRRAVTERAPAGFVGHGAPTLALDPEKGGDLRRWRRTFALPRAVVVISAHWEATPLSLGTVVRRPLVYDFSGFPRPLYEMDYPAPGAPEVAAELRALAAESGTILDTDRGLDHGVWVPLLHLFPEANVPVLQVSLPRDWTARQLFELGRRLAPLRAAGAMLLGSGNLVHNLGRLSWRGSEPTPSWAAEFDAWTRESLLSRDVDALLDYRRRAPALAIAHPSEEHFRPLLVVTGAAEGVTPSFPIEGFEYGSISRRCVHWA